jgi:rhodanese-related sulfurtransferase
MSREISVQELARHIADGGALLLIDVRQPWEHALATLPGSVLIPLGELPRRLAELQPAPGAAIVAYCHHGIRSRSAAAILERAGFENVHSLAGGIDAWSLQVDPGVPRY